MSSHTDGTAAQSGHTGTHDHDVVAREIAAEQQHVDRVYTELSRATERAGLVEAEGRARGRSDRSGTINDDEAAAFFARDALVHNASVRCAALEGQHEGLVFGRLDMDHGEKLGKEARYVGRLGVRDDDYEPLVIDWRAPAASPFYRATPVDPQGVVRRRVLRCRDDKVIGVEDDLMAAEAPDDMVIVGDGALLAALTRTRGRQMRDIVATIQAHQDEAIRASARGVTTISGGPGTGKTVVALHRAAYLLYSDRRRFEAGGVLVVGPSAAYTAYIERVLPSLGEDSVVLRSLGDVVEGVTAHRTDPRDVASVKGTLRIRKVLQRLTREPHPDAPTELRCMVDGHAIRIEKDALDALRLRVLRNHHRNTARDVAARELQDLAVAQTKGHAVDVVEFRDRFENSRDVEQFLDAWWAPVDPREALLWLTDPEVAKRCAKRSLSPEEVSLLVEGVQASLDAGLWSAADVALLDDLAVRLGPIPPKVDEERGFYEIEELDDLSQFGVSEVTPHGYSALTSEPKSSLSPRTARERLLHGSLEPIAEYAHVLVDEAQDLSPMQWRMIGRRGKYASWTIVGDEAQSSWPDREEAATAREEAFGPRDRRSFHMDTNYRNAAEVFRYAEKVVREHVPDADIPKAVRTSGVEPEDVTASPGALADTVAEHAARLLDEVDGPVAVIGPEVSREEITTALAETSLVADDDKSRLLVVSPLASKGLEYDATIVVDPDGIVEESPGGVRVLYVTLTRAAHRMHVIRPA